MRKIWKFLKDVWNGEFVYSDEIQEYYDNSEFWDKVKHYLCSEESHFANVMYLFWGDLDCPCCAFYRGVIFGVLLFAVVLLILMML